MGKVGSTTLQKEEERRGDSTKIIKTISAEALQLRKLKISSGTDPIVYFKKLYDSIGVPYSDIKAFDKFVVVNTTLALSAVGFADVKSKLTDYYNFYVKQYSMQAPEEYITVFLARDITELSTFSEKLHGFRPPSYTLGYSNLEDQCIVSIAYVPTKPLLGTACHELFHIMCKSSYETLPAWLEEGMASLYEVSKQQDSTITGLNNWRINFLLSATGNINDKLRYFSVEDILRQDWNEFNESDEEHEPKQSFHYAYSRYLMLYLQQKGKLAAFFKEAANYNYMNIVDGPVKDYSKMIKKYTGDQNFDANFKKWIQTMPVVSH